MRFWDSSAVVPLLLSEPASDAMRELYRNDPEIVVWWGTEVEVTSAIARLERAQQLTTRIATQALRRWTELTHALHEVAPSEAVRSSACRYLRVHDLRAADALQLGAAYVAAETRPASLVLVSLDERLATAAQKEGFTVTGHEAGEEMP